MKYKCKYCSNESEIREEQEYLICDFCSHAQILPKRKTPELFTKLERADYFWRKKDFDKSFSIYSKLLSGNEDDAAILWSLFLSHFGVGYENIGSEEKVVIYRLQFMNMKFEGDFFNKAMNAASFSQKHILELEYEKINQAYRHELNISSLQPPHDIYITCREKGSRGKDSMEIIAARKLYDALTEMGFSVFSPEVVTPEMKMSEREPYAFSATNLSKVMIVLGSKSEAFEDVWVKSAWNRFLKAMKYGARKTIIPCFMNIKSYELPDELCEFESFDFSIDGGIENIILAVSKFALPEMDDGIIKQTIKDSLLKSDQKISNDGVSVIEANLNSEEKAIKTIVEKNNEQIINYALPRLNGINLKANDRILPNTQIPYLVKGNINYKIGDSVLFGAYPQDAEHENVSRFIEWQIIARNHRDFLLLSKYVLDCKPFNSAIINTLGVLNVPVGTEWKRSYLRKWLNDYFYSKAFNDDEKALIRLNSTGSDLNSNSNEVIDCEDHLFCLSLTEINKFVLTRKVLLADATEFAQKNGAYRSKNKGSWWWLRSPGDNPNFAAGVDADGTVFCFGIDVSSSRFGVRPAVWVRC